MARKRKAYTEEFKIEAVQLVTEHGYSLAEACRKLGISTSMLSRWKANYLKKGEKAFPGKGKRSEEAGEVDRLREEVRQLRMENEILKKATAYFAKEVL